jgi:hypothetical protein
VAFLTYRIEMAIDRLLMLGLLSLTAPIGLKLLRGYIRFEDMAPFVFRGVRPLVWQNRLNA